jgi:hypothetical protein
MGKASKELIDELIAGIEKRNCVIARQQEELCQKKCRIVALEKEIRGFTVVCNRFLVKNLEG